MAENTNIISKFPAREPRAIIRQLIAHRRSLAENAYKNVPVVTIYMTNNQFTGWVLDLTDNDETLLMNAPDDLRAGTSEIVYVTLRNVTAVKVYHPERLPAILSDGKVTRAPGEPVPSRLELKRAIGAQSDKLKISVKLGLEVEWDTLPDSDDVLLNIRDFAIAVQVAVESIAKEPDGREALAACQRIVIRHDAGGLSATKAGGLLVGFNAAKALPQNLARELNEILNRTL